MYMFLMGIWYINCVKVIPKWDNYAFRLMENGQRHYHGKSKEQCKLTHCHLKLLLNSDENVKKL